VTSRLTLCTHRYPFACALACIAKVVTVYLLALRGPPRFRALRLLGHQMDPGGFQPRAENATWARSGIAQTKYTLWGSRRTSYARGHVRTSQKRPSYCGSDGTSLQSSGCGNASLFVNFFSYCGFHVAAACLCSSTGKTSRGRIASKLTQLEREAVDDWEVRGRSEFR